MRSLWVRGLLVGAGFVAALAIVLSAVVPSGDYLFIPNTAQPVADRVKVEGEEPPADGGAVYYVDVTVREAKWAERLLAFLRPDGASIVPGHAVVPDGTSFEDRREEGRTEMELSEMVAAAVALDAAGYDVGTEPQGARVEAIAVDVPASSLVERGDVIVGVGKKTVRTPLDLRRAIERSTPGDSVDLAIKRKGKPVEVTVATVSAPDDDERAIIGVRISQAADIDLPLDVDIDLGGVGGPSAGLPFALDILAELGEEVTRGRKVAATGELELDGAVGPIGGIKQKTIGVKRAGADIFLVPAGENADEARRYAGGLRVVPVTSFQQALSALRTLDTK
jgi:PDZ domain-containing protein